MKSLKWTNWWDRATKNIFSHIIILMKLLKFEDTYFNLIKRIKNRIILRLANSNITVLVVSKISTGENRKKFSLIILKCMSLWTVAYSGERLQRICPPHLKCWKNQWYLSFWMLFSAKIFILASLGLKKFPYFDKIIGYFLKLYRYINSLFSSQDHFLEFSSHFAQTSIFSLDFEKHIFTHFQVLKKMFQRKGTTKKKHVANLKYLRNFWTFKIEQIFILWFVA